MTAFQNNSVANTKRKVYDARMDEGRKRVLLIAADVADLLGHRDLRTTRRYAHLSPAHLAAVVKRLDGVFGQALAPSGGELTIGGPS